jgi:hypothetical protein
MISSDSIIIVARGRLPFLRADCLEVFLEEEDFAMHLRACQRVSAPRRA